MKIFLNLLIDTNRIYLILFLFSSLCASQEKLQSLNDIKPLHGSTQELVRGNGAEIISIDPHQAEGIPDFRVLLDLFEGLVSIN